MIVDQLPEATEVALDDELLLEQGTSAKKVKVRRLVAAGPVATAAANGLMSAAQVQGLEKAISNIGDLSQLSTTAKGNLVAALNEQNSETQGTYYQSGDTIYKNIQWVPLAINTYGNMTAFIPTEKLLRPDARVSVGGSLYIRENGNVLLSNVSVTDSTVSFITAVPMRAGIMLRVGLASQPSGYTSDSAGILYATALTFTVE